MQFSIKTMLLTFTGVAVSIAGLLYANVAWAAFFYTAAFALVLTGFVGALVRRGPARAFWIGFALFGGGYFCISLVNENFLSRFSIDRQPGQEPRLATTRFLLWSEPYIHIKSDPSNNTSASPRSMGFMPGGLRFSPATASDYFTEVGHSILTLMFALVGGWIGMRMSRAPSTTEMPAASKP